jgi:hypothetical protein
MECGGTAAAFECVAGNGTATLLAVPALINA